MSARSNTRAAWMLAALAVLVPQACDTGGLVGGKCREGALFCGGECIDPSTDPLNCGQCANVCAPGLVCSHSDCVPPTETGGSSGTGGAGTSGGAGNGAQSGSGQAGSAAEAGVGGDAGGGVGGGQSRGGASNGGNAGRGGAGGTAGRGGQPSAGAAGEAGAPCLPPFDTAEQCGDCNTTCSDPSPLCAPNDSGGYECVPICPPPLVNCGDQCIDVNVSALHCGKCFNLCPSGICSGATCVGASPGHVALYCMDYTWAQPMTAHTALLGNAVFLPLRNEVRILAYTRYAPAAVRNQVNKAIGWSATARGRSYRIDPITVATQLSTELNVQDYDVFLVYEQADAPAGQLAMLGAQWANGVLQSFAEAGGVIIVLDGAQGNSEMPAFIDSSGLLALNGHNPIAIDDATTRFFNRAPGDALGVGVVSPLSPVPYSCTFDTQSGPSTDTVFVVSDAASPAVGNPVVVHRTVGLP